IAAQNQTGYIVKRPTVGFVVASIDGDELIERFEPGQPHRRGDLAHLPVGSDINDIVIAGESKIVHQPDSRSKLVIVRRNSSALKRVEELGSVKAEYLRFAEVADHPSIVRTAESVSGIEHQLQVAAVSNFTEGVDLAWSPPNVDSNDPRRARSDQLFYSSRAQTVSERINVAKYWSDLLPLQCMSSRDESERWDDNFT